MHPDIIQWSCFNIYSGALIYSGVASLKAITASNCFIYTLYPHEYLHYAGSKLGLISQDMRKEEWEVNTQGPSSSALMHPVIRTFAKVMLKTSIASVVEKVDSVQRQWWKRHVMSLELRCPKGVYKSFIFNLL